MKPGAMSHIRESPVAVIAVENVVSVISDKEVIEAVVVVVSQPSPFALVLPQR
jgi:hypothetical protein